MLSKGVSPIVASIGLIIATIIIAAFLASYVTSAVEAEARKASECPDNTTLNYVSNDYPKFTNSRIEAMVIVSGNSLTNFAFELALKNGTTATYQNTESKTLVTGTIGTLKTDVIDVNVPDIQSVVITTACSNVETEPRSLR